MADISAATWAEADASNNTASPAGFPEGMLPSGVNDSDRAVMGGVKRWYNHANATITSGGSANTQTLTYAVAPTAYVTGDGYVFIVGFANTGAATINVNGLGAKNVRVGSDALVGGELQVGRIVSIFYDGTNFQVIGALRRWYDRANLGIISAGTANVQTLTYGVAPTGYVAGDVFGFFVGVANTGALTLNVNALGARSIVIGADAMAGGELQSGQLAHVCYDGTNFQLLRRRRPAATTTEPSDPAATNSTSGVMMGLNGSITPTSTGTVLITITGNTKNDGAGNGTRMQIRTGTGAAPANGAALTGTARGKFVSSNNPAAVVDIIFPYCLCAVVSGLTAGTVYWIDISLTAIISGNANVYSTTINAVEM